jgi:hypothetical protein
VFTVFAEKVLNGLTAGLGVKLKPDDATGGVENDESVADG